MNDHLEIIQEFLARVSPFNGLNASSRRRLSEQLQLLRYRVGQEILVRSGLPHQIIILYQGQARLLGYDPRTQMTITLKLLEAGEILGWTGLIRGVACEEAIASTEVIGFTLPAAKFLRLLEQEPELAKAFQDQCPLTEVCDLLGKELERRAQFAAVNLLELALMACPVASACYLPPGKTPYEQLEPDRVWFVSGGGTVVNFPPGTRLSLTSPAYFEVIGDAEARLVGIPKSIFPQSPNPNPGKSDAANFSDIEIPYAPDTPPAPTDLLTLTNHHFKTGDYPHVEGKGPLDSPLACLQMLAQYWEIPFRREAIRRILVDQMGSTGSISLPLFGAIAEMLGLSTQLVNVPAGAITRLQVPALIPWQNGFAVLYEVSDASVVLGVPEMGVVRPKPKVFFKLLLGGEKQPTETLQVLILQPTKETPRQRFGLHWFLPYVRRYHLVLLAVLVASFFVQLFGLASPLMLQVIIDKVIVQNSLDTLHVLGIFLLVIGLFEAVLTSVRTYLFVDTTNRIDLSLGTQIIDHLLRLPLRYFDKRPVGELASRINELENIRQFMTGTALTVVLDTVFSLVYIIIMLIYSWVLTVVALATIPVFILLTLLVSPIVRRQLRTKAEYNAQTQSYLVEVMSGIGTVKAQNIELRTRWQWQERYARYVSAGFKTVLTSTTANSTSHFLNQLSSLLVLWVGAYLVLDQKLSLGQLIAFRTISGYVTSPLLRLAQLWQNFQEVGLSLERLSDIMDNPQEEDETERDNIPLPSIQGAVRFENVSFRFAPSGPMQVANITLEFPAGVFVGIVGQSGSGKSTLMKLLPRLYPLNSGRILIDNYDITKVELYSLRRQVGIVPQDSLLFDGTVQENIALTRPDASPEEIIEVAKVACAHDFIMNLPRGYNTRVGERGSGLSGGQRQRITIARTLLQNPRVLILDEATSALDYQTERQVCLNLAQAYKGRTVFFITHRLSTIQQADMILVMDQGSVAELGTHAELMAMQGRYYCLFQQQESSP